MDLFFFQYVTEYNAEKSIKKPAVTPANRLIYSVHVFAALNSSCTRMDSSCLISFANSTYPNRSIKLANRSFFFIRPATCCSWYPSGNCETFVGGITRLKHFGQSGHPIPEPVLRTTPPAVITRKSTKIVILVVFINRFSAAGYMRLLLLLFFGRSYPKPRLIIPFLITTGYSFLVDINFEEKRYDSSLFQESSTYYILQ